MIWITLTRKFENQNSKLQVQANKEKCKQEKKDPLISELIQVISYERHLFDPSRGPAPEISFVVVKSFSSSLKSLHIL